LGLFQTTQVCKTIFAKNQKNTHDLEMSIDSPNETCTTAKVLHNLNPNQSDAVQSILGSTLVIAGAGSGKTAVLARRVAYLIIRGEIPGRILCLTFTNKAAGEMNHRVNKLLSDVGYFLPNIPPWQVDHIQKPLICTFHSLGVRLLREFGERIGLKKEFNILDMDDQKKIIRQIQTELNIDTKKMNPSSAMYFISQCKQELLVASDSRKISKEFLPVFHQIYKRYEQINLENQNVDFDDLILQSYLLIQDNPDIGEILQQRWWHVLVDEFQDTNQSQFELIKLICPPKLL
jgi:DNA helicase II / ATP-dependent DNA helicase PcrA